jgi:hypothetical protein
VRLSGPDGQVFVYFRDGDSVVVRNCGRDNPGVNQRTDCRGAENRVPVAQFREQLRYVFSVSLTTLDNARAQLGVSDDSGFSIKKFKELIDRVLDRMIGDSSTMRFSASKHPDDAIYTMLTTQYDPSKIECGTDKLTRNPDGSVPALPASPEERGTWLEIFIPEAIAQTTPPITVDQRITDCARRAVSSSRTSRSGARWNLVSRRRDAATGRYYETWRDARTNLLWGDALDSLYRHRNAVEINGATVREIACASTEGIRAGTEGQTFRLPSREEFLQAERNGVREIAAPHMANRSFWSSSLGPKNYADHAFGFEGGNGGAVGYFRRSDDNSVRCVAGR